MVVDPTLSLNYSDLRKLRRFNREEREQHRTRGMVKCCVCQERFDTTEMRHIWQAWICKSCDENLYR